MSMSVQDIRLAGWARYGDSYIIDNRFGLRDYYSTWRTRIDTTDRWARGEWSFKRPDGQSVTLPPKVQNIMHDAPRDMADLAAESMPTLRAIPDGDTQAALDNAMLRTAIAQGYWSNADEEGSLHVPQFILDLLYTDTCFLQSYVDRSISDYPLHRVLNPRQCLPNFLDNRLLDLYFVEQMKARVAQDLFPQLGEAATRERTDEVEITTLFASDRVVKCVYYINGPGGYPSTRIEKGQGKPYFPGRGWIVQDDPNPPGLKRPTVAWARVPTFDRILRGELDQLPGILEAEQTIVQMILDGSARAVWPMAVEFDILNTQDQGPGAVLHGDSAEAKMEYVAPPRIAPEIYNTLGSLRRDGRSTASYPEQREGIQTTSQGSATELTASQGKLTSVVRRLLRNVNELRRQQTAIDFALEEAFLNFRKPLVSSVGNIKTYIPKDAIKGNHRVQVTNGVMAGLDTVQMHSIITQDYASGLIDDEYALEQLPWVPNPKEVILRRDETAVKKIALQQLQQPQFAMALFDVRRAMKQGKDFMDAFEAAEFKMQQATEQAAQAQGGQGTLPGQPGPEAAPVGAATQQLSLTKGGIPGGAPALRQALPPPFAPPPSAQVRIS